MRIPVTQEDAFEKEHVLQNMEETVSRCPGLVLRQTGRA